MPNEMHEDKLRSVFVIHGRNMAARNQTTLFLRALGLQPVDFEMVAADLGTCFVGDVVRAGMALAQGIVALFTPDEVAFLRTEYRQNMDSSQDAWRWQSRPNVIFEAGMALGMAPERTVLVLVGAETSLFSDLAGAHLTVLGNDLASRARFRQKLIGIGCAVDQRTDSWLQRETAGDFAKCAPPSLPVESPFRESATHPESLKVTNSDVRADDLDDSTSLSGAEPREEVVAIIQRTRDVADDRLRGVFDEFLQAYGQELPQLLGESLTYLFSQWQASSAKARQQQMTSVRALLGIARHTLLRFPEQSLTLCKVAMPVVKPYSGVPSCIKPFLSLVQGSDLSDSQKWSILVQALAETTSYRNGDSIAISAANVVPAERRSEFADILLSYIVESETNNANVVKVLAQFGSRELSPIIANKSRMVSQPHIRQALRKLSESWARDA